MKRYMISILVAAIVALAGMATPAAAQTAPVLIGSAVSAPNATCTTTAAPTGTWGIGTTAQNTPVTLNGAVQTNTSGVVLGVCINNIFWQENGASQWYVASGTTAAVVWTSGSAPVNVINKTATLIWTAPTTDTMGNPIPTTSGGQTNAATSINIYQGSSAATLTKIASVAANSLTWTSATLTNPGSYSFAITYVNAIGEGAMSNVVSGIVPAPPVVVLGKPSPVTVTSH